MSDQQFQSAWDYLSQNSGQGFVCGIRPEPSIVGWAVFTKGIEQAAMFNLDQHDQAFESAKRWGASIQAVVLHPDSPQLPVQPEGEE